MRTKVLIPFATVMFLACGHNGSEEDAQGATGIVRTVKEVTVSDADGTTTADLQIDGMSCMMSCGSAIRKALVAMPGVLSAEIDFNEEEGSDHARVVYNEEVVTDAQLVEVVAKLRNGAYKVTAVEVVHKVRPTGTGSRTDGAKERREGVSASLPALLVPGLLEVLARLVRF